MLAPSSYPKSVNSRVNIITPCNSCNVCKHYLVAERKFTSKVTGKTYFIKGDLSFNSKNVIYLITCDKCKDKYISLEVGFKPRFRVHKSDIKQKRNDVVPLDILMKSPYVLLLLLDMLKFKSLNRFTRKTHKILKKCFGIGKDTGKVIVTHWMNSLNDLYRKKRKGYRK